MEFWLHAKGLQVVQPEHVTIPGFVVPPSANVERKDPPPGFGVMLPVDANIPHILCRLFKDTISVRVIQYAPPAEPKQSFLFVRDNLSATLAKQDVVELCDDFLKLAPCTIVAGLKMSIASAQAIRDATLKYKHSVELHTIDELRFDKMIQSKVPPHRVLNQDEIVQVETAKKCKRTDFPRMHTWDPIAKYYNYRPGTVLEISGKCDVSYRIVTTRTMTGPQQTQSTSSA